MMLLTKANRKALPALYSTDKTPLEEKTAVIKYFHPCGSWTAFMFEGEPVLDENGREIDFRFYGWVNSPFPEQGYFSLNELKQTKGRFGLGIERDLYFKPTQMKNIDYYKQTV